MSKQITEDDGYRDCDVCGKSFNLFDGYGLLNLEEILDCTEERQHQWQKENPDIDLTSYFCGNCAGDTIEDIEGNDNFIDIVMTSEKETLPDKYQAITSDNADYFIQGENEDERNN